MLRLISIVLFFIVAHSIINLYVAVCWANTPLSNHIYNSYLHYVNPLYSYLFPALVCIFGINSYLKFHQKGFLAIAFSAIASRICLNLFTFLDVSEYKSINSNTGSDHLYAPFFLVEFALLLTLLYFVRDYLVHNKHTNQM
jgi:hypothetical protein